MRTAPAGFTCGEGKWITAVVQLSPNGRTRRTPIGVCNDSSDEGNQAGHAIDAMPDGGFVLTVRAYYPNTLIWRYSAAGVRLWATVGPVYNGFPDATVDESGNVLIWDEVRDGDVSARFTLLNGTTGGTMWTWTSQDFIAAIALAPGHFYLRTQYDGDERIFAINGSFATDYPRASVLGG
jgi:hypothetical protein